MIENVDFLLQGMYQKLLKAIVQRLPMFGVLIPSVGILGLIGNTLSIIIFNRPEMKIWNSNGSYEMTKTSFIIKGKKYFIKDRRKSTYSTNTLQSGLLNFMFSEKATKIDEIFNVNLTFIK